MAMDPPPPPTPPGIDADVDHPINPNLITSKDINRMTEDEYNELHNPSNRVSLLDNEGQRFDLHPAYRIPLVMMITGIMGGLSGLTNGYRTAGLQYLASNSHRLPTTQNGWFYYHKRKNYVCMKGSMVGAVRSGTRLSLLVGAVFAGEAALDYVRNCIDFANSAMSVATMAYGYAAYHGFSGIQTRSLVRKGFAAGASIGLVQDALQWVKGDDVWYMRVFFGVQPRIVSGQRQQRFNL